MIKKIIIDNFMAHERTELELGPGVTILTGANNTGKSAIVEALRCVATNPTPKHYIRHGAKEARVTVEMDDGFKVVWIRKKKSAGYELWHPGAEEPEEHWKLGRNKLPEDILKVLRLDLVELETGGKVDVHVGNQREPVFLLNQPPSNAAAFFAASTESAHLLAMQNLLKKQTQEAKRQERDLQDTMNRIETEIDKFSSLPDIELLAEFASELEKTAKEIQTEIPALESVLARELSLSKSVKKKNESATVLNGTEKPPKLNDISLLCNMVDQFKSINNSLANAEKINTSISLLEPPPKVFDTASLAQLCAQSSLATKTLRKAEDQGAVLALLCKTPVPEKTAQLSELIDEIITLQYRENRFSRWDDVLKMIAEPPEVQTCENLARLLADILEQRTRQGEAQASMVEVEASLQKVEDSINKCVEALGHCPTCGGAIKAETFLDRRCGHDS
jgi:exonuclease SbcC